MFAGSRFGRSDYDYTDSNAISAINALSKQSAITSPVLNGCVLSRMKGNDRLSFKLVAGITIAALCFSGYWVWRDR
jgi:hypothetical protein